jgi:hypothetical protein
MNLGIVIVFAGAAAMAMHHEASFARRVAATVAEGVQLSPETVLEGSASAAERTGYFPPAFCAQRTAAGTYQYREEGEWEGEPYRSSGLETFDGRGNIVGLSTDSDTGEEYRFTGTYEIDGNCHGRVRYSGGFLYDIYISPDGSTIEFISTDPGTVISGPSKRVSSRFIIR